jgi:hypothetical protein
MKEREEDDREDSLPKVRKDYKLKPIKKKANTR